MAEAFNMERLAMQGRVSQMEQELHTLEDRVENGLAALRTACFVLQSPLDLDGRKILTAATDIAALLQQASIVRSQVEDLKVSLGVK